jgi:ElaB/YqjD/DUF883 family membrane-anchored ribosome-binding protein
MRSQFKPQIAEGDFTGSDHNRSAALRSAAGEWVGGIKDGVKSRLMQTGYKTETYVRSHPGRFIVGACCVGLAAGWLLGHTTTKRTKK